ncbi:MAG: thioesterase family protein [Acidobacteriota bacterium]|nr:MAG: thioesterase family protein [Acidobacteriota bacterium]
MQSTLESGTSLTERITIDRDRTIGFLGEEMRLYSTPSMVRDVEYTCLKLIEEHLDEGESSVGIHVTVDHLAATPLGQWVDVEVTVSEVDGRKVTLLASVRDPLEQVGRGEHVRIVIDVKKHRTRLQSKLERLGSDVSE